MARPPLASEPPPEPEDRTAAILDAALAVLKREGYAKTTMLQIATEASASKATLYSHFENKQALFAALVQHAAGGANERLKAALEQATDVERTLSEFGFGLLMLLTGDTSISLNRAAATEALRTPELGQTLFVNGRQSTGRLVMRFLQRAHDEGQLHFDSAEESFETLLGLLLGDLQVRMLIGAASRPGEKTLQQRAQRAVAQFMRLYGTGQPKR
ncbi:MAG: TetR/AcrR family transcriptional regulator [Cytophagales bacterium]|nr:TetR/AcrR family transcriptional regulator [Rhizobacter sp.]